MTLRTLTAMFAAGAILLSHALSPAQTPHIYGIHDDEFPSVGAYLDRLPGGGGWITATEALGANPNDGSSKNYTQRAGTTIIARLNYGYFPNGTLPPQAQYANFATRVRRFVENSTGCNIWVIGNETNLAVEWPQVGGNLEYISPANYADCFKQCYSAIKSVRPNDHVVVQALAPWAGPYGPGNLGGLAHQPQPDNWADYFYKTLAAITTGPGAVTPDGIALHINSRGYGPGAFNPAPIVPNENLTLDFSWGVYTNWVHYSIPRELWHLPLYATECNGLNWWKGGGPEPAIGAYEPGWFQRIYADVNAWNQQAAAVGLPIYRCVNMYRWSNADDWSINALPAANQGLANQFYADLSAAAAQDYRWPAAGGNALRIATPPGSRILGSTATASSDATADNITGFEPSRAVDGIAATKWSSADLGVNAQHWLLVDLGAQRQISGYIIRHASNTGVDATPRNTIGFRIEIGDTTNGPWRLQTLVRNNTPGTDGAATTPLTYDLPITARWIRLLITDASRLSSGNRGRISEFEVFTTQANSERWTLH